MEDVKAKKFNFKRKLWHLSGLIIPLLLYLDIFRFVEPENPHITRLIGMYLILIFLVFLLIIELIRLNNQKFNQFFIKLVGPLLKKNEYNKIHGSISYIFANFILFFFFTKEMIALSSLILMISDPIAAFFGIYYGKHKFKNGKSLEGVIAFFLSSIFISFLFMYFLTLLKIINPFLEFNSKNFLNLTIIIIIVSFITSLIEFFSFNTLKGLIDDNLTIPLGFAIVFCIISYFLGIPFEIFFSPLYTF